MGLHKTEYKGLLGWIDARMPTLMSEYKKHMSEYYAPKNFNFWYFFGSFSLVVLLIQLVTGIFLVMHYKPDARYAFESVEYIMREVPGGWFIRYMHSTGASFFFIVVYLHMFRALLYGSYRKPRELVWIFGCLIFLCLMAEAFFGYLLPWGQMSYWGAQVIVNLFSAIPLIGPDLAVWIRGDYVVSDATLNRFFALHVIAIPLVLLALVAAHILALHDVGSNNPDGIEIKDRLGPDGKPLDGIPFHPYYTVHDIFGLSLFLIAFFAVLFFAPEMGGYFLEWNNFIPADPLTTPAHIAPVWYFTPFYSILRATTEDFMWVLAFGTAAYAILLFLTLQRRTPKYLTLVVALVLIVLMVGGPLKLDPKFWGVVLMGASVLIFFGLPWLDQSPVKSMRYRPDWHFWLLLAFAVDFLVLGYLGTKAPTPTFTYIAQAGTLLYFAFFLLMPWWSRAGLFKPVPDRVVFAAH
ncbi:MAG: cytochrome bc complex cytochrome b subunit [Sutterellaceae bacterium]|nr:cytochrome bc complex cytochrome b subunit [Burkholderiaceae bacterium]MDW8430581.1 cytochrome bc complex cytochrome b subunit [Sutterellaceae bacterium]